MGTWKSYTEYEDSVILSFVQKNPQNLAKGFREAAQQLQGRSANGIEQHWHAHLKKGVKGFALKSDSTEVVNRKNIPEKKELRGAEYHLNALVEILQAKRDTLDTVISTLKSIEL